MTMTSELCLYPMFPLLVSFVCCATLVPALLYRATITV